MTVESNLRFLMQTRKKSHYTFSSCDFVSANFTRNTNLKSDVLCEKHIERKNVYRT